MATIVSGVATKSSITSLTVKLVDGTTVEVNESDAKTAMDNIERGKGFWSDAIFYPVSAVVSVAVTGENTIVNMTDSFCADDSSSGSSSEER